MDNKKALQDAQAAMKDARKCRSTSIFKWKPDWEAAAQRYAEAAKHYRIANKTTEYIAALVEGAEAFEKTDSYHTAAKNLEMAAAEEEKQGHREREAAALYKSASKLYRMNEQPEKAAQCLLKAARTMESADAEACVQLCKDCVSVFEEEAKGKFSNDTIKQIVGVLIRIERFNDAIEILHRQNDIYKGHMDTFSEYLYKNYLGLIVLYFYTEQYEKAEEELKSYEGVGDFVMSKEHELCEGMMDALHDNSTEALKEVTKQQLFGFLDNQVARIARKLELNEDKVKKFLAGVQSSGKEDKETLSEWA